MHCGAVTTGPTPPKDLAGPDIPTDASSVQSYEQLRPGDVLLCGLYAGARASEGRVCLLCNSFTTIDISCTFVALV